MFTYGINLGHHFQPVVIQNNGIGHGTRLNAMICHILVMEHNTHLMQNN